MSNVTKFNERSKGLIVHLPVSDVPEEDVLLHVEYYPNRISLEDIIDPANQGNDALATGLAKVLKSWDAEDNNGPIPVTYEGLVGQSVNLLILVQRAINEDIKPGEVTGSN